MSTSGTADTPISASTRLALVKWAVCLSMLAAMAVTPKLWFGVGRTFPLTPSIDLLAVFPEWFATVLSVGLVLGLVATAFGKRLRLVIGLSLSCAGALALLDLTRLQPWLYQYMLLLAAIALADNRQAAPGLNAQRSPLNACALCGVIVAVTYFWSGMQKLNLTFATEVFPWLIKPILAAPLPSPTAGLLAAPLEALIGLGLIIARFRAVALITLVLMHLFLLFVLGPFGHDFNSAVWPWNICMPVVALALFYRNPSRILPGAWQTMAGKVVLPLVGIMPALNFFNIWDDNLSASLYSGRTREAWIRVTPEAAKRLPAAASDARLLDGWTILQLPTWALEDVNVPPYPEPRVFRTLTRKVAEITRDSKNTTLYIRDRPPFEGLKRTFTAQ